jgi:threonine dehydrogenase-like Zn-dependent dehydrogenase
LGHEIAGEIIARGKNVNDVFVSPAYPGNRQQSSLGIPTLIRGK